VDSGSNGGSCVSIYAPAVDIYVGNNSSATAYSTHSGTSFSSPLAAAIGARYLSTNHSATYQQVYDYLLSAAGSSTLINNPYTPEYWMCGTTPYRTDPGVCPVNNGVNNTNVPIHFGATSNTSNAGMLYSPMSCP
jgi:subtilisin family serine protease